ncbi:MAG: nuclear transport factor 2 family protein [Cyanobacteria bacterium J06641_5]
MDNQKERAIAAAEEKLKAAMIASNVNELDEILSDDLIFTNHLGQIVTKAEDLAGHKSGDFKIEKIAYSEQVIKLIGDLGMVSVVAEISGSYRGEPANGKFRFTRLWGEREDIWQVVVGHSSAMA